MQRLIGSLGLCAAIVLTAALQSPAAERIVPSSAPASAPTFPPATQASTQPTTSPTKFSLNFKDTPIDVVLNFLSETIGFEVLKDGPVEAKVTILSKQPVSPEEAITLLNAALRSNGFTVVREGRLLHIVARDKAKKANVPVHFGNNADEIAATDELITQVIPIHNISATKLRDDLKTMMTDADVTANEGSNSIIVTDTGASVRRIVQIISKLDEHESTTSEIHIVPLKHANAVATAKLLETLFKTAPAQPQQPQNGMMMQRQPGQPEPPSSSERHGNTVIATGDERTNTLVIMASTDTLKTIDKILAQLDSDNPNPAPLSEIHAYPLKFAEADATAKLITNIFKAPKQDLDSPFLFIRFNDNPEEKKEVPVNALSDDRTNTVIVTAPPSKLPAIEALIAKLDASPMVSADLRVIHLKYADADDVAKLVEDMFKPKPNDTGPKLPFYFYDMPPQQQQEARGVKVTVTSDLRTNTVLISAPTELLGVIEKVVHELDADPTTEDTLFIYHLRNSQSAHLEYTLNVLFGNVQSPNQNNQNNQNQQNGNIQNQQGQDQFGNRNTDSSNNSNRTTSNNRNNNRNQRLPGVSNAVAQATSELTGKVLVVAEPDTNSLLVTTATKYEKQVRKIIEDLDRAVPQVLIKVLIAEVSRDNADDMGLDFSVLNIGANGKGAHGGTSFGSPTNGLVVSFLESNVTATLHALATRGKLDVLSRPYILASDNQQASITVGQTVPYVTESRLDTNNNTINTIQYRDVGIILDVTPHINLDGLVILDVSPEVSSISSTQLQLSPGVFSTVFSKRAASSRVNIMDGQTIVIGGMMQDQNTTTVQKVPLLGDIPLVGVLFQRNQVEKTKTELLIFLTPHVAQLPGKLEAMSEDESKGLTLTPQAVAPGVFQEHIRGLKRGQIPQTQPTTNLSPVNSIDLSDQGVKPAAR